LSLQSQRYGADSGAREKIAARERHFWSSTIDDRLGKPKRITCQCGERGTAKAAMM
jgi:hypothetical protein